MLLTPCWGSPVLGQRLAVPLEDSATPQEVATVTTHAQLDNYRLSARDVVQIKVFGESDLSTTARISKDGCITFPLIGSVRIGGQTASEATGVLEKRLRDYILKPQVFFSITEYSKRHFTIFGQISKPGTIEMPDEASVTLLEAIGMAGGYTRIANPSNVTVKRIVDGRETLFKLNARNMLRKNGADPRFEILPGDTILVGESLF